MSEIINSLIFDDITLEDEFRALISKKIAEDDVYNIFEKEINLVPFDETVSKETTLPAITFEIVDPVPYAPTKEDIQIQRYTSFTVEINIYTSGENRKRNNKQLRNVLVALMQSNGSLGTFYNRGLVLREDSVLSYEVEKTERRVIRFSGVCNNNTNLILSI